MHTVVALPDFSRQIFRLQTLLITFIPLDSVGGSAPHLTVRLSQPELERVPQAQVGRVPRDSAATVSQHPRLEAAVSLTVTPAVILPGVLCVY